MEQQVSWAAGRGLTFISVVQLALSVLNRLMVLKDSVKVQLCLELNTCNFKNSDLFGSRRKEVSCKL
jgi:hypothetical protein